MVELPARDLVRFGVSRYLTPHQTAARNGITHHEGAWFVLIAERLELAMAHAGTGNALAAHVWVQWSSEAAEGIQDVAARGRALELCRAGLAAIEEVS